MKNPMRLALPALVMASSVVGGCKYDEGLIIENMKGKVYVPIEAATRVMGGKEVTDIRNLGPVYLGVYSGAEAGTVSQYAYPTMGPIYQDGVAGDAYPYGGTTVGDIRYACLEYLSCKLSTGRFEDFQSLVDWYANDVGFPIQDASGANIYDGVLVEQLCYDLLDVNSPEQVGITGDVDFELDSSGAYYVADFTLWQQEFFWDKGVENCTPGVDCPGFSAWAFIDNPDPVSGLFSTCSSAGLGYREQEYDADFYGGMAYRDVLNQPVKYITKGDWVVSQGFQWDNVNEQPELYIDFEVE